VEGGVGSDELAFAAIFHPGCEDGVGIVEKCNYDVFVAFAGGGGEAASLIGGYFARNLYGLKINLVGSGLWGRHNTRV